MESREAKQLWALNLAGFQLCAGYLNALVMGQQAGRPLSNDEVIYARQMAEEEISEYYKDLIKKIDGIEELDRTEFY